MKDGWVTPVRADPGVRRDLGKVLRDIARRYTMEAAARLMSRFMVAMSLTVHGMTFIALIRCLSK